MYGVPRKHYLRGSSTTRPRYSDQEFYRVGSSGGNPLSSLVTLLVCGLIFFSAQFFIISQLNPDSLINPKHHKSKYTAINNLNTGGREFLLHKRRDEINQLINMEDLKEKVLVNTDPDHHDSLPQDSEKLHGEAVGQGEVVVVENGGQHLDADISQKEPVDLELSKARDKEDGLHQNDPSIDKKEGKKTDQNIIQAESEKKIDASNSNIPVVGSKTQPENPENNEQTESHIISELNEEKIEKTEDGVKRKNGALGLGERVGPVDSTDLSVDSGAKRKSYVEDDIVPSRNADIPARNMEMLPRNPEIPLENMEIVSQNADIALNNAEILAKNAHHRIVPGVGLDSPPLHDDVL